MEIKDPIDAPVIPTLENKWQGWPLDTNLTISSVLAAEEKLPDEKEIEACLDFYNGAAQWDERIKAKRQSDNRPTLTINMLPQVAGAK